MTNTFKEGDKVRTITGTVVKGDEYGFTKVRFEPAGQVLWVPNAALELVEAAPVEPLNWPIGTVVRNHLGTVYIHTGEGWKTTGSSLVFDNDDPQVLATIRDFKCFERSYSLLYNPEAS